MATIKLIRVNNHGKGRTYAYEPDQNRMCTLAYTEVESGDLDGYYQDGLPEECPNCGSPVDENGCTDTNGEKCALSADDIWDSILPQCAATDEHGNTCGATIYTNAGAFVNGFDDYYCAGCIEFVGTADELPAESE